VPDCLACLACAIMYHQHPMAKDSVAGEHQYRRVLADVVQIVPYVHTHIHLCQESECDEHLAR
jgi:hypothetical protein